MTDENDSNIRLSRRKVLAGLGTVGLASAGAGLGTTAWLSDTESFENNALTAGTLDLLVDWQQHYYGASEETEYVNAHPDHDEDGEQSMDLGEPAGVVRYSDRGGNLANALTCANFPGLDEAYYGDGQESLVDLQDVKPGDYGEITFSLHLCDNPGYIWMHAANVAETGGVNSEPEQVAEGDADNDADLADLLDVQLWYDTDCDNVLDDADRPLDLIIAIDTSGSLEGSERTQLQNGVQEFVDALQAGPGDVTVGQLSFGNDQLKNFQGLTDADSFTLNPISTGGNTPLPAALDVADQELHGGPNARAGAAKVIVLFSDGGPNYENQTYSVNGYTAPRDPPWSADDADLPYDDATSNSAVDPEEQAETAGVAGLVRANGTRIVAVNVGDDPNADLGSGSTPHDDYLAVDIASPGSYYEAALSDLGTIADSIVATVAAPETVIFDGSLADAFDLLTDGPGIPLDGDTTTEERDCFAPERTVCLGFAWSLPTTVGNEVQGDGVAFDLGFYTEQCRHNDGSGPESAPETTAETTTTETTTQLTTQI